MKTLVQDVVQDVIQRFKRRCVRYLQISDDRNCGLINKAALRLSLSAYGFQWLQWIRCVEDVWLHWSADIQDWYWKLTLIHHTETIWSGTWAYSFTVWWFLEPLSDHVRFVMPVLLSDGRQHTQVQCEALNKNVYEFCFCWSFRVTTDRSRFTIYLQKKKTLIDRISPS